MLKKMIKSVMISLVFGMAAAATVYAGQWRSNSAGLWYQNDDGSYPVNTWKWIPDSTGTEKCYYFDPSGYCLINTVTSDNNYVDASGAWIVNGEVQKRFRQQEISTQLTSLVPIEKSAYFDLQERSVKDTFGNTYPGGTVYKIGGGRNGNRYAIFYANQNYKRLRGIIAPWDQMKNNTPGNIDILVDGCLVYSSGDIYRTTEPFMIDVDITGAKFVRIENNSRDYGDVYLSNFRFVN